MSAPTLTNYTNGLNQVGADNLNTFVQSCTNMSELRGFAGNNTALSIYVRGTTSVNDGGQGTFYWNAGVTGTDDNGATTIVPNGVTIGCWTRQGNGATILLGTSTTSNTIGIGLKTFTISQSSTALVPGGFVVIASQSNVSNYMHGQIASYNGNILVVNVTDIGGSGTYAAWNIIISGSQGPTGYILASSFGATGDGVTDDTVALQNAINYIQTNRNTLFINAGIYKITSKLNFKVSNGWGIQGAGKGETFIRQATDNIPIFDVGIIAGANLANYYFDGLTFDYTNLQPSTNTGAICIFYSALAYQGRVTNIEFAGGYYAIKVASGIFRPWGTTWDNLFFGRNLSGGCIDLFLGTGDTPNNQYGRMGVDGTNMTGTLFKIRGYNCTIDTLEFFTCPNSSRLIEFGTDSRFDIGCIKLETYSYTVAQRIIEIGTGSNINIGDIWVGNTSTIAPVSGYVNLINCQSGGTTYTRLKVKSIFAFVTTASANTAFLISGGGDSNNGIEIGSVNMSGGWALQNNASETVANFLRVKDYSNGYLEANVGDADLTLTSGDATTQQFRTAFTAPRTINLPNVSNNLCAAMAYTFVFNGAINGGNTATIKAGTTTYATLGTDKVSITIAWRRSSGTAANDWVVTSYSSLP